MNWTIQSALGLMVKRRDRTLQVNVHEAGDMRVVIAVEAPNFKTRGKNLVLTAERVFANHGHAVIGEYKSLTKAMLAAEAFATKWKKGVAIDKCGCKEIGAR